MFGERMATAVVSVSSINAKAFSRLAVTHGVPVKFIGQVGGNSLSVGGKHDPATWIDLSIAVLCDAYEGAIPRAMGENKDRGMAG